MAQHILHGFGIGLLMSGGAAALGVIVGSVAPQWQRICRLALGNVEPAINPAVEEVIR
ncbi:hypothetical protein QP175_02620 [Sphingomonas aerolata]|uniref:hypothetical protein n=1 Tax=Sphingomonas aerolata TaxID=185951 RepID=UPI002FE36513